jgi:hypothetical protein
MPQYTRQELCDVVVRMWTNHWPIEVLQMTEARLASGFVQPTSMFESWLNCIKRDFVSLSKHVI